MVVTERSFGVHCPLAVGQRRRPRLGAAGCAASRADRGSVARWRARTRAVAAARGRRAPPEPSAGDGGRLPPVESWVEPRPLSGRWGIETPRIRSTSDHPAGQSRPVTARCQARGIRRTAALRTAELAGAAAQAALASGADEPAGGAGASECGRPVLRPADVPPVPYFSSGHPGDWIRTSDYQPSC